MNPYRVSTSVTETQPIRDRRARKQTDKLRQTNRQTDLDRQIDRQTKR